MYLHSTCLFQGYLQYKNSLLWLTTVLKPIIRIPFTCSNKQIPCFPLTERECCLYIWLERKAYLPFHFLLLFAWFAIPCRSVSKKQFSAGSAAAGFLQCFPLPAFRVREAAVGSHKIGLNGKSILVPHSLQKSWTGLAQLQGEKWLKWKRFGWQWDRYFASYHASWVSATKHITRSLK